MYWYEDIIRALAAKPIQQIHTNLENVSITFEDGQELFEKNDVALRMFFITMKKICVERINLSPECILIPLGYFKFLGWKTGDSILFRKDDIYLSIVFS